MSSIDSKIQDAMDRRKTLRLDYSGEDEVGFHERELEPWCYGIHADTGNPCLRAYQVAGYSESGYPDEMPFWRMARVDRMRNVVVTDNDIRSNSPEYYNPQDKDMRQIFVSLPK
ncbi:WYL domain-containing protein [Natrinema longum]|uniref:WYL domain-containing protein n=1 Tax=Natrinema longum TaxID=370324 RepID=A0A8A2UBT0_9EURY|nr:WYL domain-containing protein [Natrinema longum]MBZ6496004.1 WYL domain-containing protein [Natrinema longum]QSW86064.1 WYL domain-containing protein [Natrinema longum]